MLASIALMLRDGGVTVRTRYQRNAVQIYRGVCIDVRVCVCVCRAERMGKWGGGGVVGGRMRERERERVRERERKRERERGPPMRPIARAP